MVSNFCLSLYLHVAGVWESPGKCFRGTGKSWKSPGNFSEQKSGNPASCRKPCCRNSASYRCCGNHFFVCCQTILEEITNADSGAPCSPQHRGKVKYIAIHYYMLAIFNLCLLSFILYENCSSVRLVLFVMHFCRLTLSSPVMSKGYTSKCSEPYWSNPPFLIFDIRALWHSGLSARVPECQILKMVG